MQNTFRTADHTVETAESQPIETTNRRGFLVAAALGTAMASNTLLGDELVSLSPLEKRLLRLQEEEKALKADLEVATAAATQAKVFKTVHDAKRGVPLRLTGVAEKVETVEEEDDTTEVEFLIEHAHELAQYQRDLQMKLEEVQADIEHISNGMKGARGADRNAKAITKLQKNDERQDAAIAKNTNSIKHLRQRLSLEEIKNKEQRDDINALRGEVTRRPQSVVVQSTCCPPTKSVLTCLEVWKDCKQRWVREKHRIPVLD